MRNDIFHMTAPSLPHQTDYSPLFDESGEICKTAEDITPEFAMKLGRSAAEIDARIAIGYSDCSMCRLLAYSFAVGAASSGVQITDFGESYFAAVSSLARTYLFNLTVFFENDSGRLCIRIADKFALPIDDETREKFEQKMKFSKPKSLGFSDIILPKSISEASNVFVASLKKPGELTGFRAAVEGSSHAARNLREILISSGCEVVPPERGIVSLKLSDDGLKLFLRDEKERWADSGHTDALAVLVSFRSGKRELAVPPDSPGIFEQIGTDEGGRILRIDSTSSAKEIYLTQELFSSAAASALLILGYLKKNKKSLYELLSELPDFTLVSRELALRGDRKTLLDNIEKSCSDMYSERRGALRICADGGWVNLCPTRASSRLRITGEGMNEEIASELCNLFVERANTLDK